MKKTVILSFGLLLAVLSGCQDRRATQSVADTSQYDSLQRVIAQKDNEMNEMMATLNEIQEGLREIGEAENRLTIVKDGEGSNRMEQIRENIQFISQTMQRNRELINKLKQQQSESSYKSDQLKKTIDNLILQLDEKDQQLQQLREELNARDIRIGELDKTITDLSADVSDLRSDNEQKTATISTQDKQLNTAWYACGTKKELREHRILDGGKVLQGNFDKGYFTKIDIRLDKEIKLYTKSAKLLTVHPSGSYRLEQDADKQYVLYISDPETFWSASKYLVVQVK
ncbi:MAG: hypothetical protein IJ196_03315 [Prevotella sp.]|nr:hypothetical protein [Prevotella sp.]